MSIGLFLDVDNTLTNDYIQKSVAQYLGVVDQYQEIEERFQDSSRECPTEASKVFGMEVIRLFNDAGFSKENLLDYFSNVTLADFCEELLMLNVEKYLVSQGPDYYVKLLGEKFQIPPENILFISR